MAEENVKVAVRVRPFNKRERARNATCIIEMKGATTYISDPSEPNSDPRAFSFDFSYWSFDGCKEQADGYFGADSGHPNGKKFCDQKMVFDDLGIGVLNNAWDGFNSTLFAYGQTGSGKSWSMVGYGVNKGIVPMYCDRIFTQIEEKKAGGDVTQFEVTFSMLEIYNENVRDLLNPKSGKGGLRVRQHPKKGFYAEGLKMAAVSCYKEIETYTEEGTRNRTVAATNMNATSSRAHTIVGINFVQKFKNQAGEETAKSAIVNLVDLAGSERAESTGATGDRLKEGAAINQSLSALGNVIAALAEKSNGKSRVKVPYRDSVLTKLLKNALGGNSKTIMIAAISPADINYDESLSTLRYADRAKQIKTKATVNEDPTEKLIRELQEENDKLKAMLASGKLEMPTEDDDEELTDEEKSQIKKELAGEYEAQLADNEKEMEEMRKTFEEKLAAAQASGGGSVSDHTAMIEKKKTCPHLYNLNFDPMLTGHIINFIDSPVNRVVNGETQDKSDISIRGPNIQEHHATISIEDGKYLIETGSALARVILNGEPVTAKSELHHFDRLMFGTTQLHVFVNPKERDSSKEKFVEPTFDSAQEEIARCAGFDMNTENKSKDDILLQEDLMELLPAVDEANSISEELDKKVKFELMVVSPEARGELRGRTEVFVKVISLESDNEWVWPRQKFFNRKFIITEMYNNFREGDEWELPPERDPFVEDYEAEIHIGSVKIWLESLAYVIEIKEQLEITDFKAKEVGLLNVEIIPCNAKGKELTEKDDAFVDDPSKLVGKDLYFVVKLLSARGLPTRFTEIYAKYILYHDTDYVSTKKINNTSNPDWNHTKQFSFTPVTSELVEFFKTGGLMIQIFGKQKPPKTKKKVNTRQALQSQALAKGNLAAGGTTNTKVVDVEKMKLTMEVKMLRNRTSKMEQKLAWFRRMLELTSQYERTRVSVSIVEKLMHAKDENEAEKCLALVSTGK